MTQGERKSDIKAKNSDKSRKTDDKNKDRKNKEDILTKVVIRRLPPSLNEETFLEQISPVPEHDFFRFVKPDLRLGEHSFCRAYINFLKQDDIIIFKEKFDGYIFVDAKGNEFSAIVEFAPFQKMPKKKKKTDTKSGTIEQDVEYQRFLELLENPDVEPSLAPEIILDEIEAKERELKANHGHLKLSTPLLDYIKKRKEDKRASILKAREERKRRELERRKQREDEKRRRREKEREKQRDRERHKQQEKERERKESTGKVVVLKNPEREKERRDSGSGDPRPPRGKDAGKSSHPESRGRDTRPESRHKDREDGKDSGPGGDSRYKDVGARPKEYKGRDWESDGRDRHRDRGGWGKTGRPNREPRGKPEREPDRDRNRDSGKASSGGQRRGSDSDRSKGKYGKSDREGTRERAQEAPSAEKGVSEKSSGREKDHGNKNQDSRRNRDGDRKDDRKDDRKSYGKGGRNEKHAEKSTPKAAEKSMFDPPNPKPDSAKDPSETREKSEENVPKCETKEEKPKSEDEERPRGRDKYDIVSEDNPSEGSQDMEDLGREKGGRKMRYRDRPERAIYNPGQRAALRRREMEARSHSKDSPESSQSPEG